MVRCLQDGADDHNGEQSDMGINFSPRRSPPGGTLENSRVGAAGGIDREENSSKFT